MYYDFLTKWGGWAALAGMGVGFITTLMIGVLQPRNTFKWCLMSFSSLPLCLGILCLLGGWQHLYKGDATSARTTFIIAGVALCLFAALCGFSLSIAHEKTPEEEPPGRAACTRHARWLSISGFAGFVVAATGIFSLLKLNPPAPWDAWGAPLMFVLCCGGPAALLIFAFPPRCAACKTGRMRFKGSRPVWYRCQSCGETVHTHILLGSRNGSNRE
ncbi:hypothetical protein [Prosthecobacter vanneervenii]|uniref:Uncharacterized protein n=1 Tax=Prosthecobacter vanneervenii TaxID=48466 RepID=A0A7W7Y9B3_9BACT|nr:hypothetical protein [Prosthecobacter vanneervenii]MBB5031951.1 hypothetical protein [Prosthecobacter vanneervenii]